MKSTSLRHDSLGRGQLIAAGCFIALAVTATSAWSQESLAGPGGDRISIATQEAAGANPPGRDGAGAETLIPTKNLFDIVRDGGWLMMPIIICSFILVVFVLERAISLRRGRVIPRPFVKRFMHQLSQGQLDREEAISLCEESGAPVAKVFAAAVRKWGRSSVEVEQAILDTGERVANELRRYLRVINGVATLCPLLGLLGTVVGMISAFNSIATSQAMGRPELLANGISQALITTAAGMTVAIPALAFYMFFISRVDQLIVEIDALGQDVVAVVSADGTQGNKSTRTKPARQTREAA